MPSCSLARRSLGIQSLHYRLSIVHRCLTSSTKSTNGLSEEDHRDARTWLARFNANTIPKDLCELSFSRSSGPGGQNVNKVNSKATLRIHAKDFLHMIPKILHPQIEGSRYYAANSQSLVIQGDSSRNRNDNVEECYKKLHDLMIAAGRVTVRGETSQAQKEKVKGLQRKENEMRLRAKKMQGNKKAARRGLSKGPGY